MFKIGDVIVYGAQGICKIDEIQTKQVGKETLDYYILKPLFNNNTTVFVPVDNSVLTTKMQSVLTKTQAKEIIGKASQIGMLKHNDENHKREQYKSIIAGGNRENLLSLIKTIVAEREFRRQNNKKLNTNDEQTLYKAENLLYNELAFVLDKTRSEVQELIVF